MLAVPRTAEPLSWHGKQLGFTIECDDKLKAVRMHAPDALAKIAHELNDGVSITPVVATRASLGRDF